MSEVIQDNYRAVREKINEACKRVGRKPEEVTLIAVSKTKPLSDIEKLIKIDVIEFGENKPQELRDKFDAVSTPVRFHQIGHLQTNKVKYIINKAVLIHSVDSIKLASVIEKEAEKRNIHVNVLIEVNYAGEDTKFGVSKEEVLPLVKEIAEKYRHINIRGLMVDMSILSMGMTNDYVVAVEEGATMVRVGTAIFGERQYKGE